MKHPAQGMRAGEISGRPPGGRRLDRVKGLRAKRCGSQSWRGDPYDPAAFFQNRYRVLSRAVFNQAKL
jgi:hypothetical protein